MRWLEWGVRGYQSFMLWASRSSYCDLDPSGRRGSSCGLATRWDLSGIAYVGPGWVLGSNGFSAGDTYPTLSGIVLALAWPRGSGVVAQDLWGRTVSQLRPCGRSGDDVARIGGPLR